MEMIKYTKGNILSANTEAIINSVNTAGVMGKGVALAYKKAYPDNFVFYEKVCKEKKFDVGQILVFRTGKLLPKFIINFPTKKHWRNPSKIQWIESGLDELVKQIEVLEIKSIAIPPLGSGNGKLDWNQVRNLIHSKLENLRNCEVVVYEPGFITEKNPIPENTAPRLTLARAMLLYLFYKYKALDYNLNLLVSQKLAYFLQRFGEPLKLRYEKGWYGPYAPNLNKVLEYLNGHYIHYNQENDKPDNTIKVDLTKRIEIEAYLKTNASVGQLSRLEHVSQLIDGFETPFSLELLATVDFILKEHPSYTPEDILANIQNWTNRKKELMKLYHIQVAKKRLSEYQGYLN
jgi:O-acetyl-ADP-ribose deacetylase (regulator of RNase III)/uncharacterized protein YwgA